jgi:trk system potassium uptake protein TrkA
MSLQEVAIPDAWLGQTLRQLQLPATHGIQVVALQDVLTGAVHVAPDPDRPLRESDVAIVAGADEAIQRMLQRSGGSGA